MLAPYQRLHASPSGPGDGRPTASQIIANENLQGSLVGKSIFITGCSSGLGIETAKALYETGATLYLTARNVSKARTALGIELSSSPCVHLLDLDLDSFASVRKCAAIFLAQCSALNIFIANAGVMACPEGRTVDGFETQLGVNHLGHFLLLELLRPALHSAASDGHISRVVLLSSMGHRFSEFDFEDYNLQDNYIPWKAYGRSKTAVIWTANELDRQGKDRGLRAFSVHPGAIRTQLQRHLPSTEWEAFAVDPTLTSVFKTPQQGAATIVWAAISSQLTGLGGLYLEDCQVAQEHDPASGQWGGGHARWAYDAEKEKRLWELSANLVAL